MREQAGVLGCYPASLVSTRLRLEEGLAVNSAEWHARPSRPAHDHRRDPLPDVGQRQRLRSIQRHIRKLGNSCEGGLEHPAVVVEEARSRHGRVQPGTRARETRPVCRHLHGQRCGERGRSAGVLQRQSHESRPRRNGCGQLRKHRNEPQGPGNLHRERRLLRQGDDHRHRGQGESQSHHTTITIVCKHSDATTTAAVLPAGSPGPPAAGWWLLGGIGIAAAAVAGYALRTRRWFIPRRLAADTSA